MFVSSGLLNCVLESRQFELQSGKPVFLRADEYFFSDYCTSSLQAELFVHKVTFLLF